MEEIILKDRAASNNNKVMGNAAMSNAAMVNATMIIAAMINIEANQLNVAETNRTTGVQTALNTLLKTLF